MRKTKIICTMGPATDSDEVLEKLMRGGMNVARFNFSHGSHEEQKERMDRIKAMREKCAWKCTARSSPSRVASVSSRAVASA